MKKQHREGGGPNFTNRSSCGKRIAPENPGHGRSVANGVPEVGDSWFRKIFVSAKDAIFLETPEGRILDVNKAVCEMLGYSRDELRAMDIAAILPPEVGSKLTLSIRKMTVRKGIYVETENVRKDGTRVPVEVSCTRISINGQPCVIAILRDISERKAAENALSEVEERFRKRFDSTKDARFIMRMDGRFADVNPAACGMLGYSKGELLTMRVADIVPPEIAKRLLKFLKTNGKKGGEYFEAENLHRDGRRIPVEIGSTLVEIRGEKRIVSIVRDISERKNAEEALRKSELKYKTLLENLPQRIFYKDKKLSYVSCNKNFARDRNMKMEKITGKTDFDLFPMKYAESYRKDDRDAMRSGKTKYYEERYVTNGRKLIIQTVKTPVRDEKGKISGVLGIFWDITKNKQDEEKLKRYQQCLEEMVRERTEKLSVTNERLLREIAERKKTVEALRESECTLQEQKQALERKNIALGEMIEQIEAEKKHVKDNVALNVEKLLMPIVRRLKGKTTGVGSKYIDLLQSSLKKLTSTFGRKISEESRKLSPRKIEICDMIRGGLSGKEIADLLGISFKTIERHRNDIRKKFGLVGRKVNLTTFLQGL